MATPQSSGPRTPTMPSTSSTVDLASDEPSMRRGVPPPNVSQSSIARELVLVSLVVAPLLLLPIMPLRKRLRGLSTQISDMKSLQQQTWRQATLAQDRDHTLLDSIQRELKAQKDINTTLQREIWGLHQGVAQQGARMASISQDLDGKESSLRKELAIFREQFKALSEQVQASSNEHYAKLTPRLLNELASSFVDVAAFIEEVETMEGLERRGVDPRGVEKMRRLAMNLHALAEADSQNNKTGE